jgi:3',5'-cyclic-AMP phosphodiesterase
MKYFFLFFLLFSCKYKFSPYSAATPKLLLNRQSLELIKEQEAQSSADYKVALISDTHNFYNDLDELVKTINKNGPYAFVIVSGDITNLGMLEEYEYAKKFYDKLQFPYIVAVGNHDLLGNGPKIYHRMFGETDFSLTYNDALFVFFNNNNWETEGLAPDVEFIEEELQRSSSLQKILVAHVPFDDKDRFTPDQIDTWKNLFTTYNVNYFINGHNHNPVEAMVGTTNHITVGASNKRKYFELIFSSAGVGHKKIDF